MHLELILDFLNSFNLSGFIQVCSVILLNGINLAKAIKLMNEFLFNITYYINYLFFNYYC
jgi:hypothetical protein